MVLFQIKHYLKTKQVFWCNCMATYPIIVNIILDAPQYKEQQQSSQLCFLITGRFNIPNESWLFVDSLFLVKLHK